MKNIFFIYFCQTHIYRIILGLAIVLILTGPGNGQSVYSAAGLGEYQYFINGRSNAMGGVGIALPDEIMYNIQNPAAGAFLENTTINSGFLFKGMSVNQKDSNFNNRFSRWSGLYFSVKITGRFGIAGGIVPFSDYSYDMELEDEGRGYTRSIIGRGGISRGYGAFSFKILPELSVGLMFSRYFGQLEEEFRVIFQEIGLADTASDTKTSIYGNNYRLGGFYRHSRFSLGGFYAAAVDIKGKSELAISPVLPLTISEFPVHMPSQWGVGATANLTRGWITGMDVQGTNFKDLRLGNSRQEFNNSSRIGFGAEFTPLSTVVSSYLSKIQYRMGFSYQKLYVPDIDGSSIKEYGVSFGFGFPFNRNYSRIDLAIEYGKRGSKEVDIVQENFLKLSLYVGIRERWFQRRSRRAPQN